MSLMQQQQQQQRVQQQEDEDETSWNSLDGRKSFEAPPDSLQRAAHAGIIQDDDRQLYFELHPF